MRVMRRIALVLVLAVLIPAEVAQAGGWATVELGEPPSGLVAGTPWRVELIVKQHGVTPMADVSPSIRIVNNDGIVRQFAARPTGRVGTYVAEVTFPSAGTWRARLFDGFTNAVPHRISALRVEAATASSDRFPWHQTIAIAIVALLWGWGLMTTREPAPAPGRRRHRTTPRVVAGQ
jgi:hypothetical protein